MKLTKYITDLGRAVAFYPGLKRITNSTTATILLCQLMYWSDKTSKNDGWIYKTSDELEEETGLTVWEQKTAKQTLVDLGFVEKEIKPLDHTSRFRVNQDAINKAWELATCGYEKTDGETENPDELIDNEFSIDNAKFLEQEKANKEEAIKKIQKKGDLVDGILDSMNSSGFKKASKLREIQGLIERKLHINADNKRWKDFIGFAYVRETEHNEPVMAFINWALKNGFDPIYWTPEKMRTLYPQAFRKTNQIEEEDFVEKLPEMKEEVYSPMPKELGLKREL